MAEIIGYKKKIVKKYKGECEKCGAIVVFNEDELKDDYQYNEYCYSVGICPSCGESISLNKNKDIYSEEEIPYTPNIDIDCELSIWPNIKNCIRDCKKCQARCLYRKEKYPYLIV